MSSQASERGWLVVIIYASFLVFLPFILGEGFGDHTNPFLGLDMGTFL